MDVSRGGARPRRPRGSFLLSALLLSALVLVGGAPPGAVPAKGGFPLPDLRALVKHAPDWSGAFLGLPRQPSAPAPRRGHQVPADETRANGGAGSPPGDGVGALPAYEPPTRQTKPATTPPRQYGSGYNPATSKPIDSAASATSDVYANPDGSVTRKTFEEPVNYRAPDGAWRPIDTTLVRGADGRLGDRASNIEADFAGGGADPTLAAMRVGNTRIGYRLNGAVPASATVDGATATYPRVLPDTDLALTARPTGIGQAVVLRSKTAARSWRLPLNLGGLAARVDSDGSVGLRDSTGVLAARITPGHLHDSGYDKRSGRPAESSAVTYRMVTVDGAPALEVSADAAWLSDPKRVYPVTLEWGIDTPPVAASGADLSFANPGADYHGAKATSASLHLFATWAADCGAHRFDVRSSGGATIGSSATPTPKACANSGHDPDVGDWVGVPVDPQALGAAPTLTLDASGTKQFDTDRNAPYLLVTYAAPNVPPQVDSQFPPDGYAAATLTPELLVTSHDPDNWPGPADWDYIVFNQNGDKVAESGFIRSQTWTVPASAGLRWGQGYAWTVLAGDGQLPSTNQSINRFTTAVPQPLVTSSLSQNGEHGYEPTIGNYTTAATDAVVPTVGPALTVQRSYNSLDTRVESAFGLGWSSFLDMRAAEVAINGSPTPNTVVIRYPNGQEVTFGKNPDGTFAPPAGRFATLTTMPGNNGYKLVDKDGTAYVFMNFASNLNKWVISQITDAAGRTENFGYLFEHSDLSNDITSASGRHIHLDWTQASPSGRMHVAAVTTDPVDPVDPNSTLTWRYSYDGDQLTKVCPPTSATACTTYAYTAASPHPNTVLNAGPTSYWRLSEASGTVAASSVLGNEGSDNGTYANVTLGQPGPLPGSAATAASFNGTSSSVVLPSGLVQKSTYQSIGMWFKTTSTSTGTLFSTGHAAPGAPADPGAMPVLYVGSDGKLYGHYWNGTVPGISSPGKVNDGNWHHVMLTSAGSTQILYLDGAPVGQPLGGQIVNVDPTNIVGAGVFNNNGWPAAPSGNSWNYFNGSISDVAFYNQTLTGGAVKQIYASGTASVQVLASVTRPSGGTTAQISYDPVTAKVSQVTDSNGGQWRLSPATASGTSQVYVAAVRDLNPTNYWRLGENGGAVDAVNEIRDRGYGNYSSVTLGSPGPFVDATAASFNGSSSSLMLPSGLIAASSTLSLSMWFKTTSTSTGTLFSTGHAAPGAPADPGAMPVLYVGSDGKLHGHLWDGTVPGITSGKLVNDGNWHHVVLASVGTNQTLYLDGASQGTIFGTISNVDPLNMVGAGVFNNNGWPAAPSGNAWNYFNGSIAEVSLYRGALSVDQVAGLGRAYKSSGGPAPVALVRVTDPGGKTLAYAYDPQNGNRMVSYTDGLGNTTYHGYDTGGFLRTVTDPNGTMTTTEHDVRGNTVSQTTCQNTNANKCSTVYYTYYPDATTRVLTPDPRNDLLLTSRDGRSTAPTDNRYLTSFTYDAKGNRTRVTDPLGRNTDTGYTDGTTVAAADNGFAPAGLPSLLTTPGGARQTVVYNRSGDIARVTDPAGKVTSYTYDGLGRVSTRTETTNTFPNGLVTRYTYDGQGRALSQQDPAVTNRVTGAVHTPTATVGYDVDGQVTSQTVADPTGGDASRSVSSTYNDSGQVASTTDAAGKTIRFEYDAYGNMVKETDADGGVTATTYDSEGRLLTSTLKGYTGDPNNPSPATDLVLASKVYDPAGRLASVTDAMGWVTSYTYTDNNLAAKTTRKDPASGATFVQEDNSYDPAGNLTSQVTGDGATTAAYTVDPAGRTTSATLDPAGLNRTTAYTLSPDDTVLATAVSDASGTVARSEATYDPLGRITSRTVYNDGGAKLITTWSVDQGGLATSTTNPKGRSTFYSYDEAGRAVVSTSPQVDAETGNGAASVRTVPVSYVGYDTFGEPTEAKDPNGDVTVTGYDAAGRVAATHLPSYLPPGSSTPISPVATRAYDSLGQLVTSTDPLGKQTTYSYDQLGRVARMTAPNGGQTKYTYDLVGDQLSETDPTGAVSAATYDYLGRKATSTDVVRQDDKNYTTEYTYGTGGWLTKTKSPAGVVTQATYDAAGEQVTVTDGANNVTRYAYDGLGRVTRTTLPDGTYRTATYDLAGRTTASRSYDAGGVLLQSRTNEYDANGNVSTATDPRGSRTDFYYDPMDRLIEVRQPVGPTETIFTEFGYDAGGNRTRFTDGRGNYFFTKYNSWDLPESVMEPSSGSYTDPADRTFTVTYDADGRPASRRSPGGVTVTNTYDDMGDLTRQAGTGAEVTTAGRVFGYDLAGRVTSAAGSAGSTTLTYDDRGLPRTISGASGSSSFAYNPDGQMASRADAAGTTNYTYDGAGRLSAAANPAAGVQLSYGYNSLSQVKTIGYGTNGNTRSFGYDGLHRLTADELKNPAGASIAKIAYGYDPNGNETSKTTTGFAGSTTNTYTYDLADRLISWNNGTATTTYAYDRSGNRTQAGGRTFSYDERNRLQSASDGTTYQYTPRGTLKATISGGATLTTKADAFDQIVSQDTAGASQAYTYDGFGRVIRPGFAYTGLDNDLASDGTNSYTRDPTGDLLGVATGSAKTLAWTDLHDDVVGEFTATGSTLAGSAAYDPFGKVLASTTMAGSLGYQSEWTDPATGRVNMLARWYNPDTGQFDTRDTAENNPVPDSVDANRFAYADDNPMTNTDPTGHWSLGGLLKKAKSVVSKGVQVVAHAASTAWNVATSFVSTAWHAATSFVSNVYHATVNYTAKKIDQGRKYVAHKAQQAKQIAKKAVAKAKQVGRVVVTKATRVVQETVNHVKDVYDATAKWVKEHKDALIEVAAIAGGVLAGLACTAATAGAGAVACMVGAAALINLAKDAAQGHIHNWGDAFGSLGTGALQGLAGGVGGIVGGKIAALAVGRLGAFGASIAGRALAGGIAGGAGDAASQYATTGHVNWGGVAMSAGIGAVFGGAAKGGASSGPRGSTNTVSTAARSASGGERFAVDSAGTTVDRYPDVQSLARAHADEVIANRRPGTRPPTAVAAAHDQVEGTVHFGESGRIPSDIHPELRGNMPDPSLEPWSVGNCAEFNACNNALNSRRGAKLEDLVYSTVRTRTGAPFESCNNCKASLRGAKEELG